jgi:hypothetical protein
LDESLLSVSKIGRFVATDDLAADCDKECLDLGLVAAFRAKSSMGITAITLVLGVAPESVSESNPDTDDNN